MCGDLLQSIWENAHPWAQFSALLLCVHNVVLHLLVRTSVTTVICWELSFYVVFPQLLNSHQCLIQVPFLVVHSEPLHGSSAPPACTPGHGKDSLQVHLFMHLLGYPSSVTGHYPTDFLFFFFFSTADSWLSVPMSLEVFAGTRRHKSLTFDNILFFLISPSVPLRSMLVGVDSLTFPVTLLFLSSWE